MYTTKIKYYGFDDKEHEITLHFALTYSDLITLQNTLPGGLVGMFDKIVETGDKVSTIILVKSLLVTAYGKPNRTKTLFDKSNKIKADFVNSAAYQKILRIMLTDGKEFEKFLHESLPVEVRQDIDKEEKHYNMNFGDLNLGFITKNKKTIFDDLSNLGFKLKTDEE